MKILVVDDDQTSRVILRSILLQGGDHEIAMAGDGEEALSLLHDPSRHFDLLFLDIEMPKVNGLEVLKTLQEERCNIFLKHLKVVVCSSLNLKYLQECVEFGARLFVAKPIKKEVVEEKMRMAVAA